MREALDELLELTLLRPAGDSRGLRAVSPEVGLTRLLARNQNQLLFRQQQLESARSAIAALSAEFIDRRPDDEMVVRLDSLEAVRDRLEELAATATEECLSLMRGERSAPIPSRPANTPTSSRWNAEWSSAASSRTASATTPTPCAMPGGWRIWVV
ncbi:hypothetical protein GCM10025734_83200 [Kitasatospora paranensis]|uniref:hypothetical protein n=1 Tax=Kitasatospora paranensis TaxID=258053 RepID=UPI0031E8BA13